MGRKRKEEPTDEQKEQIAAQKQSELRHLGTQALHVAITETSRYARKGLGLSRKDKKLVLDEVRAGIVKELPQLAGTRAASSRQAHSRSRQAQHQAARRSILRPLA